MRSFGASGGGRSRCSKGLPIDGRGVGGCGARLRRAHCFRGLQFLWLLLFSGVHCPAIGDTVTLAWDGADVTVAGYRLYYGVGSRTYPFVIDVGPATSCSVPDLIPGASYFFAVTAYSDLGIESNFSSEIAYTCPPGLRIGSIFTDNHGTILSWASEPGTLYRVLAAPTLSDPVWVDVSGPLLAASTTRLWVHIRRTSDGSMFYRLEMNRDVR
jgi:hypothetical protein